MAYFEGKDEGRKIVAPGSKDAFVFKQSMIDEISKGKNLAGKTYKGTVTAWPGNMTGSEVINFWIDKAASADGGYDLANGYNYPQLISKFIMGAVFYNQIADNYLDEFLEAEKNRTTSRTRMARRTPAKSMPGTRLSVTSGRPRTPHD